MKNPLKYKILILCLCFFIRAQSQNLVPNGSFEIIDSCMCYYGYLFSATPWFQPSTYNGNVTNSCSSDLFNSCCVGGEVGVPSHNSGYQNPRTGNGYGGIACQVDTGSAREYIEVALDSELIGGQKYCVEFYVSLADICSIAISNIGAYFSVDSLLYSNYGVISLVPQIANSNSSVLSDKINWMKIFGVFTAQGGEKFMTIGNFLSPANTVVQNVGGSVPFAYYYIDDIFVTACDTTWIGVNEIVNQNDFTIYPNPASTTITIESIKHQVQSIRIMDVLGREVFRSSKNDVLSTKNIDVSQLLSGIYILQVQTEKGILNKKFVKE